MVGTELVGPNVSGGTATAAMPPVISRMRPQTCTGLSAAPPPAAEPLPTKQARSPAAAWGILTNMDRCEPQRMQALHGLDSQIWDLSSYILRTSRQSVQGPRLTYCLNVRVWARACCARLLRTSARRHRNLMCPSRLLSSYKSCLLPPYDNRTEKVATSVCLHIRHSVCQSRQSTSRGGLIYTTCL